MSDVRLTYLQCNCLLNAKGCVRTIKSSERQIALLVCELWQKQSSNGNTCHKAQVLKAPFYVFLEVTALGLKHIPISAHISTCIVS